MKIFLRVSLLAFMVLGCAHIPATPSATNDFTGYRLAVELSDGTRIVGESRKDHFQFHSDVLGDLDLPLEKIRSLESLSKTNLFKLASVGADSLTVAFAMKEIPVATAFGDVALPVDMIQRVRVSRPGKVGRPMDGLIGLWSVEGDAVGGNNGIPQNVTRVDGVTGQAFLFAPDSFPWGTWTGVRIADKPAYELTHSLSIDAWIRPRGNGYMIFFRGDHRPVLDPYHLSMDGQMNLEFGICDENNTPATVKTPVGLGSWIHVAGVLDDATGRMSLYTNGVLAAQTTTSVRPFGPLLAEESPGVGIGNDNDGGNDFPFIGEIDEVGLYGRALSEDEVNAIYGAHAANAGGRAEGLPTRGQVIPRPWRGEFLNGIRNPAVDAN